MKFLDTHFDDYIQSSSKISLHPHLKKTYEQFPNNINNLNNLLFYGPSGVGKYTQALNAIKKYSQSDLKYEKKLTVCYNKTNYYFKISDIHFEIDMSLSEHGLKDSKTGKYLPIKSEDDIFKKLNMKYLKPSERNM